MEHDQGGDILVFQKANGEKRLIDILSAPLKFYYKDDEKKANARRITPNQLAREKYGIDGAALTQCLYGRTEGTIIPNFAGMLDFTFRHAFERYLAYNDLPFPEKEEPIVQTGKRKREPEFFLDPDLKKKLRNQFVAKQRKSRIRRVK